MPMPPHLFLAALLLLAGVGIALGEPSRVPAEAPPDPPATAPAPRTESVEDTLCRLIERSARANGLPVEFFTRLIWRESSFRSDAVSPKGAQGIAQFMPGTAADHGLADPFDPETALPASAALLADLRAQFGSLGLAAAAYNAGPARVEKWLAGQGGLPLETQAYLLFITGREAEDWAAERRPPAKGAPAEPPAVAPPDPPSAAALDCHSTTVAIRKRGGPVAQEIATITAPWGVQLSGNFSKARALASYQRAQKQYAKLLEGTQPMIIGSRLRFRGSRAFYRVRVAQQTRKAADALCNRLRAVGGACVVFPS
ncbi:transglycosylase SLT domain-containing protein [Starkeya sp. ORNL1]|uniref:transglycosylase SLT domain-containing protein n=1 Tax=Starkeya sp. ORNL1 TaxID=2709380 RepID=UPI0032B26420